MNTAITKTAPLALCSLMIGCGGGGTSSRLPWDPERVTVVQPGIPATQEKLPGGDACLVFAGAGDAECIRPQDQCAEGEAADVVVNESGELLDVVCLPADADLITPAEVVDGGIPQNENNTAIVFDDATYEGDLDVDGNKVILYGDGPDEATLEGDLTINGNNAAVRGLTVDGDVTVEFNGATFVFCRITGNLTIRGNNTHISGCEVWGDVLIEANNTELEGNLVGGEFSDRGKNTDCGDANFSFADTNENGVVDEDELGSLIDC